MSTLDRTGLHLIGYALPEGMSWEGGGRFNVQMVRQTYSRTGRPLENSAYIYATETLLLRHYPLLLSVVRKMTRGVPPHERDYVMETLLSDAIAKVLRLIRTWDPETAAWTTYVQFALRRELLRYRSALQGVITVRQSAFMPDRWEASQSQVQRVRQVVRVDQASAGWGVRRARRASHETREPDTDVLAGVAESSSTSQRREKIGRILQRMHRQGGKAAICADVLGLRMRNVTLDQIGLMRGVSRERVRQLEMQAMEMVSIELDRPLPWSRDLNDYVKNNLHRKPQRRPAAVRRISL